MPDWQILGVRFTVFVTPETEVPTTLWRDVIGEDPESSMVQRAVAIRTETGPFAEGTLTLQIQPMRIDWSYEPLPSPGSGAVALLGPFPNAARPFLEFAQAWANRGWFPSTTRLALGFILISPTPDRATGYRELSEYINGVPTTGDATDFVYQVNLPRSLAIAIDSLQVNRLSRWSVGGYQRIRFSPAEQVVTPLQHHLRLELDINTSADFSGSIPRAQVGAVIDDLLKGAGEICREGALV